MNEAGVPSTEGSALACAGHLNRNGSLSVTDHVFQVLLGLRDYITKKKTDRTDVSNSFGRKRGGGVNTRQMRRPGRQRC